MFPRVNVICALILATSVARADVVIEPQKGCEFACEDFVLKSFDASGHIAATYAFHSSYGAYEYELLPGGLHLLVSGVGKGTSVRSESLLILELKTGKFEILYSTEYSAYSGPATKWQYRREIKNDILRLELKVDGEPTGLEPKERTKKIILRKHNNAFKGDATKAVRP